MTKVGEILDNFLVGRRSKLWIMYENDDYTKIVRSWRPVKKSIDKLRLGVQLGCSDYEKFRSINGWEPQVSTRLRRKGNNQFDVDHVDMADYQNITGEVSPETVMRNYKNYLHSRAKKLSSEMHRTVLMMYGNEVLARQVPNVKIRQTPELHTSVIGSFTLFRSVDEISCDGERVSVTFNVWMFNSMSEKSLGIYARDIRKDYGHISRVIFPMKTQVMWWNWKEKIDVRNLRSNRPRRKMGEPLPPEPRNDAWE